VATVNRVRAPEKPADSPIDVSLQTNRFWRIWRVYFKPSARDIAVFLACSLLIFFRVPMPVQPVYNFCYSHPWLALITLLPISAWLPGAYVLGAIGFVIWIVRLLRGGLHR